MAIDINSLRVGGDKRPPTMMIYGTEGIGKSTIAAYAPSPVFLQLEDGLGELEDITPTFGLLKTFQAVDQALDVLTNDDHPFETVAVDSADWLEKLIWTATAETNGWDTIETPGYGKGYDAALDGWRYLLDRFTTLRNTRKMGVIILAHASVVRFESPETAPYDRYTPKLHESKKGIGANPLLREYVDCVFFNNWRTSVLNDKTSNDKKDVGHNRGVGGGQRLIYTQQRPAFLAKNRFSMPAEIILPNDPKQSWNAIAQFIPYYSQTAALAA